MAYILQAGRVALFLRIYNFFIHLSSRYSYRVPTDNGIASGLVCISEVTMIVHTAMIRPYSHTTCSYFRMIFRFYRRFLYA